MRRNTTSILKLLMSCAVIMSLTAFFHKVFSRFSYDDSDELSYFQRQMRTEIPSQSHARAGTFFNAPRNLERIKIDWHDYRFMEEEQKRTGLGEHGKEVHLPPEEKAEEERLFALNGFSGLVSDKISVNRSVPDIRHTG